MSPFLAHSLGQRVHGTRGRTLRGGWGLVPLIPKEKGLVVPKVFTAREMDVRLLHGRNPKPYVPSSTLVRVRSKRKPFFTLRPFEHTKSGKYGQNANIGTYVHMGHHSPYNMAYTTIGGPIVSVYKHTYYGSSAPLDP